MRALDLTVVTLDDPEYPERLRRVDMPPPLLFVRGSLAALTAPAAVAVVGTRRPTDKGRLIAAWIGSALARAGAVVVSGLAVGIDGAAHAAVVAEGGCPQSRFSAVAMRGSSRRPMSGWRTRSWPPAGRSWPSFRRRRRLLAALSRGETVW